MLFSKDFLDLNLKFAQRVSDVTGRSLSESLLEYTHLYLAFGLGRDFDHLHPIWQAYLRQLKNESDEADYTRRFYLEQEAKQPKLNPENAFGCFSYALWDDNRIRLHFHNATQKSGVLQKEKVSERIAELKAMFEHLNEIVPISSTVVGGSWLYNSRAYPRLFPVNFLQTAKMGDDEHQFLALWGQFLRPDGNVRPDLAQAFLDSIEKQNTLDRLKTCFPYQVLRLESPITDFYACYGIE